MQGSANSRLVSGQNRRLADVGVRIRWNAQRGGIKTPPLPPPTLEYLPGERLRERPRKERLQADWYLLGFTSAAYPLDLFADTYRSYRLATVRYPVLETSAKVEAFENGRGWNLKALRAGKPRTASGNAGTTGSPPPRDFGGRFRRSRHRRQVIENPLSTGRSAPVTWRASSLAR